ncbi:MAG: Phospholipase precursor [Bacteroidota bacterium]|jgi:phosphatidylserine/phosphatidylglycerophosphate/cardiolipin synthase-like enzyme
MKKQHILRALVLTAFSISLSYGQKTIIDEDYTLSYENSQIMLQLHHPNATIIQAIDAQTKVPIAINNEGNVYRLTYLKPAEIIKVNYQVTDENGITTKTTYVASPSSSSGAINVFFNHEVNTTYAQIQTATNLSNTLDEMLINYINACENTLDIAVYSSSSLSSDTGIAGALNAAYTRGVQVRVIYDQGTTSSMIGLLNPNIPTLASPSGSSYGLMHNKFVIFDANHSDPNKPYVWTGSTNWTVAQIDGPDRNSVITIQDQALAQGYKIEFEEMWGSTTMTPNTAESEFGSFKTDNTPHHYIIGGKTIDSYFSPSDGANAQIINAINSADSDINVATMLITRSDISAALITKYNSGIVDTNIVTDTQNPSGNQFNTLQAALPLNHVVKFTNLGVMHHKFMVIDNFNATSDPLVLVGSHNWSNSAENKNDENTLIVHDLNIANQYYQAFAYLYLDAGGTLLNLPQSAQQEWSLFPNPTKGIFTITTKNNSLDSVVIKIYDSLGKCIMTKQYSNLTAEILSLGNQPAGLYFVTLQSNGRTWNFKVIKD